MSIDAADGEGDDFEMMENEQGNTMFRVPSNISNQFRPLFNEIDNNKDRYGIVNYSIRCSTLEEVFIKIGEEEEKAEDKEFAAALDGQELLNEAPKRTRAGCCRLTYAQTVSNLQSRAGGGTFYVIIGALIVFTILACSFAQLSVISKNPPLNYGDIEQTWSSVTPIKLNYNKGGLLGNTLVDKILTMYGPDVFE